MPTFQHTKSPLPRIWLMTDERIGHSLADIVRRLPRGSGVIFRHYSLEQGERKRLFTRLRSICRRRGHLLFLSDDHVEAVRWHADGLHDRRRTKRGKRGLLVSMPVHNLKELAQANRAGADLVFISPVYATASHPGKRPLGVMRFGQLARLSRRKVIALGGMNRARAQMFGKQVVYGWAGVSALSKNQPK